MSQIAADADELLSTLNDSRRRQTLYYLLANRHTDLDSLSLQIAAWERDETIAAVPEDASEAVAVSLHHNHIPRLAESGIVEYDTRSGDIVRGSGFDEVEPVVRQLREAEEGSDRGDVADRSTDDEDPAVFLCP